MQVWAAGRWKVVQGSFQGYWGQGVAMTAEQLVMGYGDDKWRFIKPWPSVGMTTRLLDPATVLPCVDFRPGRPRVQ